jgi:hypothetical protein
MSAGAARSTRAVAMVLVAFLAAACPSCGGDDGNAGPASQAQGVPGGSSGGTPGGRGPETTPRASACALRPFPAVQTCRGATGPWAEALQKALWFFHANRCGADDACTRVQWRGKDHAGDARIKLVPDDPNGVNLSAAFIAAHRDVLDPDGDGLVDVGGGFHDAGDYIKFGLTTAFSASTLAWSALEFPDAYRATGLDAELEVILRAFGDFMARNAYVDRAGELVAFAHQVGDATDHTCGWMPPELRDPSFCPRKAYFASEEAPAADVTASAAAALAQIALVLQARQPEIAAAYLAKAKALYRFAARYPDRVADTTGGLYVSEYAWDDLSWAAVWLYESTKDDRYLKDVFDFDGARYTGWAPDHLVKVWVPYGSDLGMDWAECWTQCWNSLRSGVFVKLATIYEARARTDPSPLAARLRDGFRKIALADSVKWANGGVGQTPAGFSLLASWGSGRYNSAAQLVALVYAKAFPSDAAPLVTWAKRQMAYLLGDNPLKSSYMMGFGAKYESHPHHAAAHASIYGDLSNPQENQHVLWGALLNGPSDGNDGHHDERTDYGANEVAIDYNASFAAALAAHYVLQGQGQCPLAGFPPVEPPIDEFYSRSRINLAGACNSQVEIALVNHAIHVPRYEEHLSARYYLDASELGAKLGRLQASLIYDRGANEFGQPARMTGPTQCKRNPNLYYVQLDFEGQRFWGEIVKLKGPPTVILQVGVPDDGTPCGWNAANDWSAEGLTAASTTSPHVPVYVNGARVFGQEPDCEDAPPPPPPPPGEW